MDILKISWRSLWRSKRRTLITISAIAFGLALAVFLLSLVEGVYHQMINDAVRMQGGHITLEHGEYRDAPSVDLTVDDAGNLRKTIERMQGVVSTKLLILGQGVLKSSSGAVGVSLVGIEPSVEKSLSPLAQRIVKGSYLEDSDKSLMIIGSKLAARLAIGIGKKAVISTNNASGELVEELLRVKGIFQLGSPEVDGYLVQVPLSFARKLYGLDPDHVTQLGVILQNPNDRDSAMLRLREIKGSNPASLYSWEEIIPSLANYVKIDRASNRIFNGIIIFLSLFTIFNTILMSAIERTREFAMMLALGTPQNRIRAQVFCESAIIGLFGCLIGLAVGGAGAYATQVYGLDLTSLVGEGVDVSGFAMDPKIHAKVTAQTLGVLGGIVLLATLLISLVPMARISRISIAEVLR